MKITKIKVQNYRLLKDFYPDFAYVLNFENGKKKLYFIIETKNTDEESLRNEETQKIKHAEKFFGNAVKIQFKTQFSALLAEIYVFLLGLSP